MALTIQTNFAALTIQRHLTAATDRLRDNYVRLATGQRNHVVEWSPAVETQSKVQIAQRCVGLGPLRIQRDRAREVLLGTCPRLR